MTESRRILVTGAGGFIGSHLVKRLVADGHHVMGVDLLKPDERFMSYTNKNSDCDDFDDRWNKPGFDPTAAHEFRTRDLRYNPIFLEKDLVVGKYDDVYALAADMGGMGFISANHAKILRNNLQINLNTIQAARQAGVKRYLFTSSACVYPEHLQSTLEAYPLKEEDAYPAEPQDAYGWEKLTTEKLCTYYRDAYGLDTRIVRFHAIYGPQGTWYGGREKAPAALCRKIAIAKITGDHTIEVWGDGKQIRSFCYIDDCVEGIVRLMESGYQAPLNLGTEREISINDLAYLIAEIAGIEIVIRHVPGPQGVRARNSDNRRLRKVLGWEPQISLEDGLARTYAWIEQRVIEHGVAGL